MPAFIRNPKDFFAGFLLLLVGIAAFYLAQGYPMGTSRRMGPGYFPTMLAGLLVFLSLILVLRSLFGRREAMAGLALKPAILVLGGALLFALLLRPAGLVIAIVSMVLVGAIGSSRSRPLPALLLASGLAGGSVLVFTIGLGQPLPILGSWFTD